MNELGEQPKKGPHRYTEVEYNYVKANILDSSTAELAEHIGVTTKALQHQIQAWKLSPKRLDQDNLVTAQEFASLTGTKYSTLVEDLNHERIVGRRRNLVWEVPVPWIYDSKPEWEGKTPPWQDLETENGEARTTCISCGSLLKGGRREAVYCSPICKYEFAWSWNYQQEMKSPDPNSLLPAHLRLQFQHWLRSDEMRQIYRLPWAAESSDFKFKSGVFISQIDRQIRWALTQAQGLFVNQGFIAAFLALGAKEHGLTIDPETDLVTMDEQKLERLVAQFQNDRAFVVQQGAVGVGEYSNLVADELVVLRQAWQKINSDIRLEHLASSTKFA